MGNKQKIINIAVIAHVDAEKYSGFDTSHVRVEIEAKRVWLRDNEPEEYERAVGADRDIFELWIEKGYIDQKLLPDS